MGRREDQLVLLSDTASKAAILDPYRSRARRVLDLKFAAEPFPSSTSCTPACAPRNRLASGGLARLQRLLAQVDTGHFEEIKRREAAPRGYDTESVAG
jgi:hypothetical protein